MSRRSSKRGASRAGALAALALCAGFAPAACLSGAAPRVYRPSEPAHVERQRPIADGEPQLERGRPAPLVDALNDRGFSLFAKLLLLNRRVQDHRLPEQNERVLARYLELNQLRSVKIRHNQYAPLGEWRRLWANREVGLGYRASFGLLTWLRYTLLPDRLLGGSPLALGDHYNPFTNTAHVFSSDLAMLLHEAGHAKDFQRRTWKGSWALLGALPGLEFLHESAASGDALRFLACIGDGPAEVAAYRTLIPAFSSYVAGFARGSPWALLPVTAGGHLVAWRKASARERVLADPSLAPAAESWRRLQPAACQAP